MVSDPAENSAVQRCNTVQHGVTVAAVAARCNRAITYAHVAPPPKQRSAKADCCTGDTFALTIKTVPGSDVPPIIRLRHFLKLALRSYGLRCIECRETHRPPAPPALPPGGRTTPPADTRPRVSTSAGRSEKQP
jgi:hypothetical protein